MGEEEVREGEETAGIVVVGVVGVASEEQTIYVHK